MKYLVSLFFILLIFSCHIDINEYDPVDNLYSGYHRTWWDDFNKELNPYRWGYELGYGDIPELLIWGWGVGGLANYTSNKNNVYLSNGCLTIQANYLGGALSGRNYTSSRLNTRNKVWFQYGIITARIKLPYGKGIFPAFWLLGTNDYFYNLVWPRSGEIDIVELKGGGKGDSTVSFACHWYDEVWQTPPGYSVYVYKLWSLPEPKVFSDDFHIFEIEKTPYEIIWRVDRIERFRTKISNEMTELQGPMYIIFNLSVGATLIPDVGSPDSTTIFPQKMYIDWIRYYVRDIYLDFRTMK